jgi:hypothetical protein
MKTKLLETLTPDQTRMVVETKENSTGGKDLYMKGIFIQGGCRNHNQRVYPVNEISKAVDQINECIRRGESILGEADHPEELTINLDRVSHVITEMRMDGNNGLGKLKIIPTPMGNIIRTLLECDVKLGVSSRGSGNVDGSGYVSDFEIITVDIVAKPSAPEAYPRAVYEALNYAKRGVIVEELAEAVRHDPKAQKYLREELLGWINSLK